MKKFLHIFITYFLPLNLTQWHPTPVLLLENPMDGGAWQAAVHGVAKSQTRLNDFTSLQGDKRLYVEKYKT